MSDPRSAGQRELLSFNGDDLDRRRRRSNARARHRQRYWRDHDRGDFECPDCGVDAAEADEVHVHHIDRNPLNGDPDNLVALCRDCHLRRHDAEPPRSLDAWKNEFLSLGGTP